MSSRRAVRILLAMVLAIVLSILTSAYSAEVAEEGTEEPDISGMMAATSEETTFEETSELTGEEEIIGEERFEEELLGFKDEKVTLDFKDADIHDVLRLFAQEAKVNIVWSEAVQGIVTIKLTDVHWEVALKKILEKSNLALRRDEYGIYNVLTKDEVGLEPLETKVYTLSYASAESAAEILKEFITEDRGKIQFDKGTNSLIISDVPAQFETIEMVLEKLDKQIRQVSIEVKVLERTAEAGSDIGIRWDFLKGWELSGKDLVARDYLKTTTDHQRVLHYRKLETTRRLEPWLGDRSASETTTDIIGDPAITDPDQFVERTIMRSAILSAEDAKIVLSALAGDVNTELVSNPKIATVDNRLAKIEVIRKIPIPQYTYNSQTGAYEITDFTYEKVGIILKVTPHINQDDFITLDVVPEVSTQYDEKEFVISGGLIKIPVIDSRTAETRVIVKSNETLVIAGLVSTDEVKTVKKVPLLGDIPLVGLLFRHTSKLARKKDLLFFITPTIVEGAAVAAASYESESSGPENTPTAIETTESKTPTAIMKSRTSTNVETRSKGWDVTHTKRAH